VSSWGKFRRLTGEERRVFLAALVLLPAVRAGLRTLGLRRVEAVLGKRLQPGRRTAAGEAAYRALRTARMVAVAARYAGGTCLAQSLVLTRFLERAGIPAELRIGVRKGERGFEAHAWVEAEGTILNDTPDVAERFAAFEGNFAPARVNWR
jgi:hypothetical protein